MRHYYSSRQRETNPPKEVTIPWLVAEFGLDWATSIIENIDSEQGLFVFRDVLYRLVLEVEVDEPVIYL